jgi:hypothetical protein
LFRLGGAAFIVSSALFLVNSVLQFLAGPPSAGPDILSWTGSRSVLLAITAEVLFFALLFMIPAVIALHESLARTHRAHAAFGCGVLAATIPVFYALVVVQGRLVYPVFHVQVHTPELAEFAVALYFGGLHTVALLYAVAALVLSLAMRRSAFGGFVAYLGFITAASQIASSFPDLIGPMLTLISGLFFSAWFAAMGIKLYRMRAASTVAI